MRGTRWILFAVLGCLTARGAEAQTCTGGVPLQRVSWHADSTFSFAKNPTPVMAVSVGTTVSYGPVFGQFAVGGARIVDEQYSIPSWTAGAGVQIPVGPISACVIYGFQRSVINDLGPALNPPFALFEVDISTATHAGSLALGVRLWSAGRWVIVPTAIGALAVSTTDQDNGLWVERQQRGLSALKMGVGFLFRDRLSVTPAVSWPLYSPADLEGGLTGSITVSVSLWQR